MAASRLPPLHNGEKGGSLAPQPFPDHSKQNQPAPVSPKFVRHVSGVLWSESASGEGHAIGCGVSVVAFLAFGSSDHGTLTSFLSLDIPTPQ